MTYARQLHWLRVCSTWGGVALTLGLLCGCGGSSAQKVLYAVGLGSPNVTIFAVSASGALVPSTSVSTGSAPNAIAIDPLARFAYILNSSGGGPAPGAVSQYVLNKNNGNLTAATFSSNTGTPPAAGPIETGVNPSSIALDSTGVFVFVANQGLSNAVPGSCLPPAASPGACPSISVFSIDQVGGTLTEILQEASCTPNVPIPCPLLTSAAPTALASTGKMLFVAMANAGVGSVSTFTFDSTGHLGSSPVSTIVVGVNPSAMALDAGGKFLFLADPGNNSVEAVGIGSSGQLTLGTPVATGLTPVSVHIRPGGGFLYTANKGSDNISAFSIDSSGALKALSGSPFGVAPAKSPSYVTSDSSGNLLFVANFNSNNISVFSIDSTGALKQAGPPSSFVVINPVGLASIN